MYKCGHYYENEICIYPAIVNVGKSCSWGDIWLNVEKCVRLSKIDKSALNL